ncbi:MAG: DUF4282 domain-containing protein [Chloroflexota bacterium]|nr:DUF4282 domain-containing protein [Chloroflexota bacterium]
MTDFLTFKRMITPILIQIVFWIAVVLIVIAGLLSIIGGLLQMGRDTVSGISAAFGGLLLIVFGPLVARIYAEILIVIFRMNETLTDISRSLAKTGSNPPRA